MINILKKKKWTKRILAAKLMDMMKFRDSKEKAWVWKDTNIVQKHLHTLNQKLN